MVTLYLYNKHHFNMATIYYDRRADAAMLAEQVIMFQLSPLMFQIIVLFFPLPNLQGRLANRHLHTAPIVHSFFPGRSFCYPV